MDKLLKARVGTGIPHAQVADFREYATMIHIPTSEEALIRESQAVVGFTTGLLATEFRDFAAASPVMRLARLTIGIETNGISKVVYDDNVAVPSTEKELAEWLDKLRKSATPRVKSLIIAASLPLIGSKQQ